LIGAIQLPRFVKVTDTNGTAAKFVWNLRSVMTRVDRDKNLL